ncbi:hypothetical protein GCM10023322_01760 [Rugosimonospora acidiphila]|uniref:Pterin-4-alpha-carbinolamine dehydratase n=1 Tax=Rugosimonospora acidiphila TaxID=556531 RepID=A0ABP9RI11_9ACTN
MSDQQDEKQMEGDNPKRRELARQARAQGRRPSQDRVTLGSSKQIQQSPQGQQHGPAPAGAHKPAAEARPQPSRPGPAPSWPRPDPELIGTAPPPEPLVLRYREVVGEVGRRIGVDFEEAKSAAEAAVTVLARALNEPDRERFLDKVPAELHENYAVNVPYPPRGVAGFVEEVGRISHRTPDVARYQAQTVISVLSEQDSGFIQSLYLPPDLRELVEPPAPAGGGLVGPDGRTSPLSAEELSAALDRLPYWSGNSRALTRTITLPPANLDRVLDMIDGVRRDFGRGPKVTRDDPENATLVVRTTSVDAVTAPDVDLAHRLDDAIDQAGAGIT